MSIGVLVKQSKMEDMANRKFEVATKLGFYWLRGFLINFLVHYPCYRRTINSTRTLLGDCATSSDHVVIYGINLGFDHELKILSCPEPVNHL